MHNRLLGWINGHAREMVGVYWGSLGICLAHQAATGNATVVYVPISKGSENSSWAEAVIKLEALCGVKIRHLAFAVALSADDVFVKAISAPEGLDETQLEQVAIVEAVANLPVPPEEICLDFIRESGNGRDEVLKIAFCRRERIDEILAYAEEIDVPIHVVDRDIQAVHDVIAGWILPEGRKVEYPFGILLTDVSPRFAICLGPTDFELYPISFQTNKTDSVAATLIIQMENCWTRCKMIRSSVTENLSQILLIGSATSALDWESIDAQAGVNKIIDLTTAHQFIEEISPNGFAPEEVLLIAMGMCKRDLV